MNSSPLPRHTLPVSVILVIILTASCCLSGSAATIFNDFEGPTVPNAFVPVGYEGGGVQLSLNSSIVDGGVHSLEIELTATGSGQAAGARLSAGGSVTGVSFSLYDAYAASSPYYTYFYLTSSDDADAPADGLFWLDQGYGGDSGEVNIFNSNGSEAPYTRSVGWHSYEAVIEGGTISYYVDGLLLGAAISPAFSLPDTVTFIVSSMGTGNHVLVLDNVRVVTVPEATTSGLLILGIGVAVFIRWRSGVWRRRLSMNSASPSRRRD